MEKWEKNKSSLCSWSPTEISEEGFQWDFKKNHSNVIQSGPKKLTQWMTHTHNIWGCCGEEEGVAAITRGTRQWKAGAFSRWQVHGITANTSCSDSSWWIHRTLKKEKNSKGSAWYSGYKMRQAGTSGQGPPWISINPVFRALSTWDFSESFPISCIWRILFSFTRSPVQMPHLPCEVVLTSPNVITLFCTYRVLW